MPLVHWLPKNASRHAAIELFTRLGIEPRWKELRHMSAREKAGRYFEFSINRTYYRRLNDVVAAFNRAGIRSAFESHRHDRILRIGLDKVIPEALLSWLVYNFVGCVLVAKKE